MSRHGTSWPALLCRECWRLRWRWRRSTAPYRVPLAGPQRGGLPTFTHRSVAWRLITSPRRHG